MRAASLCSTGGTNQSARYSAAACAASAAVLCSGAGKCAACRHRAAHQAIAAWQITAMSHMPYMRF